MADFFLFVNKALLVFNFLSHWKIGGVFCVTLASDGSQLLGSGAYVLLRVENCFQKRNLLLFNCNVFLFNLF